MPAKNPQRKFVSVDPSKCTGCGICEYACTLEKGEAVWNPIRSRIRVVRMTPLFNFALTCRACDDAKCVKACPEKALSQSETTGLLIIDDKKCKGCDWCVQACEHGGITIHSDTGKAIACDLCQGEPKCKEACPEEALDLITSDEEAEKRFSDALQQLPAKTEELTTTVKNRDWKPLLAAAEKRSEKVTEKLEMLNKKAMAKKQK
ncbi:MAG: 4Fe-4S dicluster domain-containing protein [Candidatus Bathyarchaeota archaeon]|jgi:Fe-S-cluster-containing hydrogenase component 2|nr:4Fe-4S dicluster domain-containing protein [Candidatus Bathyarchaeota archaeon]